MSLNHRNLVIQPTHITARFLGRISDLFSVTPALALYAHVH